MSASGIYGLSGSGLDIESMVKMGMMSKQNQYDKMQQTYTLNEWKKEAYLEIYDKVNEYNTSTLTKYKLSSNMNTRSATSSNSAIKATANSSAPVMNHTITVNNTATNAYLLGTDSLDMGTTTKLLNLTYTDTTHTTATNLFSSTNTDSNVISFTIGGDSDSGVTTAPEYAYVSFSSTALSSASKAKNLLEDALADINKLVSVDKITVTGEKVNLIGTKSGGASTTTSLSATDTALAFTMNDGTSTNSKNVNITYGDLAAVLNDDDADFQDFVDLLNKKIEGQALNIKASYDEDKGFIFTNTNAANKTDTVSVSLSGTEGLGYYIGKAIYDAGDTDTVTKSSTTDTNEKYIYSFNQISDAGTAATFSSAGKAVSLKVGTDTSVYDLVSAVNQAGTNVRATFDASNNTFSFYNTKTGSANSIAIKANNSDTAKLLTLMGLKDTGVSSDLTKVDALTFSNDTTQAVSGKNASVLVDGELITDIDSNNFERKGVTYDISNVTTKTSSTVSVSQDIDKIVDNVKSFVEDYNKLLDDLYTAYRETPNKSYKPLTEAQKNEMTEEQIKKWEEKAKAGMLYHDSTLRNIIDNMRSAISDRVSSLSNSNYDTAYSIGISTTGLYGQLQLDEDKLRAALVDDSDSVYNVFAKLDSKATSASDASNGIAQRLSGGIGSVLYKATESIKSTAGTSSDISDDSTLNVLLRNLQTRMSNFQAMMSAFEDKLYKKYDAMESALASLGTQMNYVSSMFAS